MSGYKKFTNDSDLSLCIRKTHRGHSKLILTFFLDLFSNIFSPRIKKEFFEVFYIYVHGKRRKDCLIIFYMKYYYYSCGEQVPLLLQEHTIAQFRERFIFYIPDTKSTPIFASNIDIWYRSLM